MSVQIASWLTGSRWPIVPLRYVAKLGTGHTPSRQHPEYWENCTIPWMTLADVWQLRGGTVDVVADTSEKISALGLENSAAVKHPAGTVILSRTASVGLSAILGTAMATSQDFATWTCGESLDPRYLLYALRAMAPDLRRLVEGSTHKTIYMPDIVQLRIPLPPRSAQSRTVAYLDDNVARLDQLLAKKQEMLSLLDEREVAVVAHVFGDQVQLRSDGVPVGIGDTPAVPLGRVAVVQTGLTLDARRELGGDPVTVPYLRVANVQDGRLDLEDLRDVTVPKELAARCQLRPGDVLMTEGGDPDKLGRGAIWSGQIEPCLHQNHVFALRPDAAKLLPEFLAALTRTSYARAYFEATASKTTGIASTSASKISAFRVPLPSLEHQRLLVQQVGMATGKLASLRSGLARQIGLLQERRQALITAAVIGQLDIPGAAA